MNKVTLKDVAKAAGVSYATVSRALSGSSEIGSDTRERIIKLCDEMGYTTNFIARSMVKKKTDLIGFIVPSIDNPFMSELAFHVELSARKYGYNIMFCNSYPDLAREKEAFRLMVGRQVDGILIIPQSSESCKNLEPLTAQIPTVFLSENLRDFKESYVSVDNRRGTELGTEYLYSLGHRKIVYFGRRNSTTHQLRAEGYRAACERLGLTPRYIDSPYSSSSVETGYEMAKSFLAEPINYTAVFASTDSNAIGFQQAAAEMGIGIPGDISLLGFDNIRNTALPQISLTTVEQPKAEMAAHAVRMLRDKIDNDSIGYTHEILLPSLIERKSCREV